MRDELRDRLEANLGDAFFLIEFVFQRVVCNSETAADISSEQSFHAAIEAIKSLHVRIHHTLSHRLVALILPQAWLIAVRVGRLKLPDISTLTTSPLSHSIRFLAVPRLAQVSMELLAETLNNQPNLLERHHMASILEFLTGKHGEQYALALLRGVYEDDTMHFLDLLLRYATTEQMDILTHPLHEQNQRIL